MCTPYSVESTQKSTSSVPGPLPTIEGVFFSDVWECVVGERKRSKAGSCESVVFAVVWPFENKKRKIMVKGGYTQPFSAKPGYRENRPEVGCPRAPQPASSSIWTGWHTPAAHVYAEHAHLLKKYIFGHVIGANGTVFGTRVHSPQGFPRFDTVLGGEGYMPPQLCCIFM